MKMNQLSPDSLIKVILSEEFRPSPMAVMSRAEDMFYMTPVSLDELFSPT